VKVPQRGCDASDQILRLEPGDDGARVEGAELEAQGRADCALREAFRAPQHKGHPEDQEHKTDEQSCTPSATVRILPPLVPAARSVERPILPGP
jgi:hypothetical protein